MGRDLGADPGIMSHLAWERLGITQEKLERVAGEKDIWNILLSHDPTACKQQMDG